MSPRSHWTYVAVAVLVIAAVASAMSIETDPVKVTHRNSGPRYDIDEVERTKLTGAASQQDQGAGASARLGANQQQPAESGPPVSAEGQGAAEEASAAPLGHVAIRRIFLFPMMRPGDWSQQDQSPEGAASQGPREMQAQPGAREDGDHEQMPSMFAKPFWPFMTPARPSPASHQAGEHPHRPHLFGADEASRPPTQGGRGQDQDQAASGPERDQTTRPLMFDPIQMMMDMMHQAISSQLAPNFTTDLNNKDKEKESTTNSNNNDNNNNNNNNDNSPAESSDERPQMPAGVELIKSGSMQPGSKNETREDIVEIEGKKYLRKVVTHRHVGDNIIFMTRRLIFVPLNETDSPAGTTDTVATTGPTESPITTAPVASGARGVESEGSKEQDGINNNNNNNNSNNNNNKPVTAATTGEPFSVEPTSAPITEEPTSTITANRTPTTTPNEPVAPSMRPTTEAPASSEQPTSESNVVEATTEPKPSWAEPASDASARRASERLVEESRGRKPTQAPANNGAEKPAEGA